jgi:hypothetical protein
MPFYCGSRVDHKGQGKLPRCHSLIPYTDVVRSGAIPPVPRDRLWSLSTNSACEPILHPISEKRQSPVMNCNEGQLTVHLGGPGTDSKRP